MKTTRTLAVGALAGLALLVAANSAWAFRPGPTGALPVYYRPYSAFYQLYGVNPFAQAQANLAWRNTAMWAAIPQAFPNAYYNPYTPRRLTLVNTPYYGGGVPNYGSYGGYGGGYGGYGGGYGYMSGGNYSSPTTATLSAFYP